MDYSKVNNIDEILSAASKCCARGAKLLVIDNLNKIANDENLDEIQFIKKILNKLRQFAQQNNVLVLFVAHPKKMAKDTDNQYIIPSPYDICGSKQFFDDADFIITVHRNYKQKNVTIKCDKVRFRNYGITGKITLFYDPLSGNYFGDSNTNVDEINELCVNYQPKVPVYQPFPFVIPPVVDTTKIDYMAAQVSFFTNVANTTPTTITLAQAICDDAEQQQIVDKIRKETNETKQKEMKKQLHCYSFGCTFAGTRNMQNINKLSGLMYIDIDEKDNVNVISNVPDILRKITHVVYFRHSCRGKGYSALIAIGTNDYAGHWRYFANYMQQQGITIDAATKDVTHMCFFSFDPDAYSNKDAVPLLSTLAVSPPSQPSQPSKSTSTVIAKVPVWNSKSTHNNNIQYYVDAAIARGIDLTDNYQNWLKLGIALISHYGDGVTAREYYHKLSCANSSYNYTECENKWHECQKMAQTGQVGEATIPYFCKQKGII